MWGFAPEPLRFWYCLGCSQSVYLANTTGVRCRQCGGENFSQQPKPHSSPFLWNLTEDDRTFLRVQRIDPQ